jgi:hypothetical protein
MASVEELLRSSALYRSLCPEETVSPGKEIILETFGPGDAVGAVRLAEA